MNGPLRKRYLSINFRNQNLRCFYWNKNAQWGKSPFTVAFNFCLQLHFRNRFYRTFFFNKCYVQILIVFCIKTEIKLSNEFYPILWLCTWGGFKYVFVRQWVVKWLAWSRGGVWPGKNHKYFKKRKLNIEFQIFFLFNSLLQ